MSDFPFPREAIILDACCIINLYASGCMRNILESIPKRVAVATYVHTVEARRIFSGPAENVTGEIELINLQPLIDDELLQLVSLENEVEENTVINISAKSGLDTGEVISAAIALHRQWSLGTDDRDAISFFRKKTPHLHLISTLDILKHWTDTTHPQSLRVKLTLDNIQNRARYKPHDKHPHYEWWKRYKFPTK